jgi:peptidoglycan/LPS O-acetylase OafA/YrhL
MVSPSSSGKFENLEFLRGIAALSVVIYHFCVAFVPQIMGPTWFPVAAGTYLNGTIFFGPLNGPFCVAIFFVLSSYVLTYRILDGGSSVISVLICIAKRIPRLALLTTVGTMLAYALFLSGLMLNQEIASVTGSFWALPFGGINPKIRPSFFDAFSEGALCTFFGSSYYNSALWTMKFEFIGSIFAFVTAWVIATLTSQTWLYLIVALRCARVIGAISFPIYVVHVPLIGSAAGKMVLYWKLPMFLSLSVLIIFATALAFSLSFVDRAWVRLVNRAANSMEQSVMRAVETTIFWSRAAAPKSGELVLNTEGNALKHKSLQSGLGNSVQHSAHCRFGPESICDLMNNSIEKI